MRDNPGLDIEKRGIGTLIFTLSNLDYTGTLTISQGKVALGDNAPFESGSFSIASGATLTGSSTVKTITMNEGTLMPGSLDGSTGTLTVKEDYMQASTGRLAISLTNDNQNDVLSVSGTANLNNGILEIDATPGVYRIGQQYTVLTATTINDPFTQAIDPYANVDFSVISSPNSIIVVVTSEGPILNVDLDDLTGNAKRVGDYLFSCGTLPPNEDLINVMDNLAQLPNDAFIATLPKLSPVQMRALPLTAVRNDTQIADLALKRYDTCSCPRESHFWVTPLIAYYKQEPQPREIGFRAHSQGVSVGQMWILGRLNCGLHADYFYSKLNWNQNAGMARLNTVYLSPFIGYLTDRWHFSVSLVGARTFYDVNRVLRFGTIRRTAHHNHKSWNGVVGIGGGGKFATPAIQQNFFIAPEAKVNYFAMRESSYQETGADSINLVVEPKHSAFLNPQVDLKFIKEFPYQDGCFSITIWGGWQSFIPLSNARYDHTVFLNQQTCQPFFFVEGITTAVHQPTIGAMISLIHCDHLSLKLDYEASLADHAPMHQGAVRFFWKW
ncbi:MAG: autotransporter domain-containing protein [Chlamydiota bacterium]